MAQKTIAFYPSAAIEPGNGKVMHMEIGPLHVACALTHEGKPFAFEYFELSDDINDWSDVFFEIKNNSLLLDKHFGTVNIVCNFKEALLIPAEKSSSVATEDYLSLIHGESAKDDIKHDKISTDPAMVNVFRIKKSITDQALRHFRLYQLTHVYSGIIAELDQRKTGDNTVLRMQVYPSSIIVVLWSAQKLQFIQTFTYATAEDICYYLLSILKEYELQSQDVQLEMSGFIEPHGELHRRLQHLFSNRHFHNLPEAAILPDMLEEYHPHTFTPFFNTVV